MSAGTQATAARRLQSIQFQYALSGKTLARLLAVNQPELDEIASGEAVLPQGFLEKLYRLERFLGLSSAKAWTARVTASAGCEALFDARGCFIAISRDGRSVVSADGCLVELPEKFFLHRSIDALFPPIAESPLGSGGSSFGDLIAIHIFSRRRAGVQMRADINFGPYQTQCVMEFWPVLTADQGVVAHSMIHRLAVQPVSQLRPGSRVHWLKTL